MIKVENVSVKYKTDSDMYTAIANVNLEIPDGVRLLAHLAVVNPPC